MSDKPDPKANDRPSRMDSQPVARRDVLGLAAKGAAGAAGAVALLGLLRLPKAAVLPSPSRRFKVNLPESLLPGEPFLPPGRSVALFKDKDGEVYAISTVCTHLGCIVKPVPTGFDCPCHGSRFSAGGQVLGGPAPKGLPWLAVTKAGDATYLVDEGKIVPAKKVKS